MKARLFILLLAVFTLGTLTARAQSTDSDGDGLPDDDEIYSYGTDPYNWDTDGDGLSDGDEINYGCDPLSSDTDGDGLSDYDEVFVYGTSPGNWDTDNDVLSDGDEIGIYGTNPNLWDSNGNGIPDGGEIDSDNDGLSDYDEVYVYYTDRYNADSDGDGLSDGDEVNTHLTNPHTWDSDGDQMSDYDEVINYGTDPNVGDTDGDGFTDWEEVNTWHTDPLNANSHPVFPFSFSSRLDFSTGSGPIRTVAADLDGDGQPDLVVANAYAHTISIYRNASVGGPWTTSFLASPVTYSVGNGSDDPLWLAAADLNGDGKKDLAVTDRNNNRVAIFRNISSPGTIAFTNAVYFTTGSDPRHVEIIDVDGDNQRDLVIANSGGGTVSVLRNIGVSGNISFTNKVDFPVGANPEDLSVTDVDGDGKPDLVVVNVNTNVLSILRNVSASGTITSNSFDARIDLPSPNHCATVAVGDLDGDGKPDVVTGSMDGPVSVYRNTMSGAGAFSTNSFAARVNFSAGWVNSVAIGDFDLDGKRDVAVLTQGSPTLLGIFQNLSTPGSITTTSLTNRQDFPTGWNPNGLTVADFDRDGAPDIAFANCYSASVSLYRNMKLDSDNNGLVDSWETQYFGHLGVNALGDDDGDGLSNAQEFLFGTSPLNVDSDGDGFSDKLEVQLGMSPAVYTPARLGYWRFNNTNNWIGENGQLPLSFTNVTGIPSWSSNALVVRKIGAPAYIRYRDIETNGRANLLCNLGSVRFWFRPDWNSSTIDSGTGPQSEASLVEFGTKSSSSGWWGYALNPPGTRLYFGTQTSSPSTLATNVSGPISWISNRWHQLVLTYSSTNCTIYVDGQLLSAAAAGATNFPNATVRAQGFSIGSSLQGTNQVKGQFDELETFNYPLSAAEVSTNYLSVSSVDSDGDGTADIREVEAGRNPFASDAPGGLGGTGLMIYTPLKP